MTSHLTEKSVAEDQLPPLGPVVWAAGSQSELTPSESLTTSDAVRNTLLRLSMAFSHISSLSTCPEVFLSILFYPVIQPTLFFYHFDLLPLLHFNTSFISFSLSCLLSSLPALSLLIRPCLSLFSDFNFPSYYLHCL